MSYSLSRITELIPSVERTRFLNAVRELGARGARIYLVGGMVRDLVGDFSVTNNHDIDIEVHDLSLDQLADALRSFGVVNMVGKSFGVLKWEHSVIDWVLPRTDARSLAGSNGRKPQVTVDPAMPIYEALRRRDLTINAMALDLRTGKLVDPFNGQRDLERRSARSPDPDFFADDPLRFYRVMQLVGRFELTVDPVLTDVCREMDLHGVSHERIHEEFNKLFLHSTCPSLGLRWIYQLGRLSYVAPELASIVAVRQSPLWHPEGGVFEHTMQAIDAAAKFDYSSSEERLNIISAVLCHDLGKSVATRMFKGKLTSSGHAEASVPLARALMHRITGVKKRIKLVCVLVEYHMRPLEFLKNNASDKAYKRLAVHLAPLANIKMLSMVAFADRAGRNPARGKPLDIVDEEIIEFIRRAKECGVLYGPEQPVLEGSDLKGLVPAGPEIGKLLCQAYDIQINENVHDTAELLRRVLPKSQR